MGRVTLRLILFAASLSALGCQDGESGGAACVDGDAPLECECMAGVAGVSRCQGGAWQPCECDMAEGRVCAAGAELACSCEGELQGVQRCLEDGAGWSRCDCDEGDEGDGGGDEVTAAMEGQGSRYGNHAADLGMSLRELIAAFNLFRRPLIARIETVEGVTSRQGMFERITDVFDLYMAAMVEAYLERTLRPITARQRETDRGGGAGK